MSIIPMDLLEQVRILGPAGLLKESEEPSFYETKKTTYTRENPSPYCTLMRQIIEGHPRLNEFFAESIGVDYNGGSVIYLPPTYGLKYEGIGRALELLGVRSIVADSFEKLKDAFATKTGRYCMVCDAGLLQEENRKKFHAISLFVENTGDRIRLCINDPSAFSFEYDVLSEASPNPYMEPFKSPFPEGVQVDLCISEVRRQNLDEPTCPVYAIEDCVEFNKDPDLIEKVFEGKGRSLPPSMMSFIKENGSAALVRAIEHQIIVMNEG